MGLKAQGKGKGRKNAPVTQVTLVNRYLYGDCQIRRDHRMHWNVKNMPKLDETSKKPFVTSPQSIPPRSSRILKTPAPSPGGACIPSSSAQLKKIPVLMANNTNTKQQRNTKHYPKDDKETERNRPGKE